MFTPSPVAEAVARVYGRLRSRIEGAHWVANYWTLPLSVRIPKGYRLRIREAPSHPAALEEKETPK